MVSRSSLLISLHLDCSSVRCSASSLDYNRTTMPPTSSLRRLPLRWYRRFRGSLNERDDLDELIVREADRHGRRRPFSTLMKRLANLTSSSSSSTSQSGLSGSSNGHGRRAHGGSPSKHKSKKNNPYPLSGRIAADSESHPSRSRHLSFSTPHSVRSGTEALSSVGSHRSLAPTADDNDEEDEEPRMKSAAPTVSTNGDAATSIAGYSKAGTTTTAGPLRGGGEGSTFSSPSPSIRSLTTTLTTVQSAAPSTHIQGNAHQQGHHGSSIPQSTHSQPQFSHQFPISPATAIPSHLAPHSNPTTYNSATANNLLTDNASILTLASSTKRRRRNSLDTNASVRALAPSSVFGGSRESLPLSLLSGPPNAAAHADRDTASITNAPGTLRNNAGVGPTSNASAERASIYSYRDGVNHPAMSIKEGSITGSIGATTVPVPSLYGKTSSAAAAGDAASVRSGLLGHSRADSASGGSPLPSPAPFTSGATTTGAAGRISRRSSGWGEVNIEDEDEEQTGASTGAKDSTEAVDKCLAAKEKEREEASTSLRNSSVGSVSTNRGIIEAQSLSSSRPATATTEDGSADKDAQSGLAKKVSAIEENEEN